jgi:arylsulfatase A-like enzyme
MSPANDRPNLLYIFTDQQSFDMMSCAGNDDLRTPAMDSIAEAGVRFNRAYCTDPVCVPSRFSMMTGRLPGAIGQRSNASRHLPPISDAILNCALGHQMTRAGYDAVYGGKVHMPKNLNVETAGFRNLTADQRDSRPSSSATTCSRNTRSRSPWSPRSSTRTTSATWPSGPSPRATWTTGWWRRARRKSATWTWL